MTRERRTKEKFIGSRVGGEWQKASESATCNQFPLRPVSPLFRSAAVSAIVSLVPRSGKLPTLARRFYPTFRLLSLPFSALSPIPSRENVSPFLPNSVLPFDHLTWISRSFYLSPLFVLSSIEFLFSSQVLYNNCWTILTVRRFFIRNWLSIICSKILVSSHSICKIKIQDSFISLLAKIIFQVSQFFQNH